MLICGECKGTGRVTNTYRNEVATSPCERCGGDGLLPDPELQRVAKALETLASEAHVIRRLLERQPLHSPTTLRR